MTEETLIKILAHIEKLQQYVEQQFTEIASRLTAIESELKLINRKIDRLNNQMLEIAANYDELEDRVAKLEGNSGIQ